MTTLEGLDATWSSEDYWNIIGNVQSVELKYELPFLVAVLKGHLFLFVCFASSYPLCTEFLAQSRGRTEYLLLEKKKLCVSLGFPNNLAFV